MPSPGPSRVCTQLPSDTRHTLTLLSKLPVASREPAGVPAEQQESQIYDLVIRVHLLQLCMHVFVLCSRWLRAKLPLLAALARLVAAHSATGKAPATQFVTATATA
jgi:hypothetical protein